MSRKVWDKMLFFLALSTSKSLEYSLALSAVGPLHCREGAALLPCLLGGPVGPRRLLVDLHQVFRNVRKRVWQSFFSFFLGGSVDGREALPQ